MISIREKVKLSKGLGGKGVPGQTFVIIESRINAAHSIAQCQ